MTLAQNNKRGAAAVLAVVLLIVFGLAAGFYGRSHRPANEPQPRVSVQNGGTAIVVLDPGMAAQSGIRVETLKTMDFRPHMNAYGIVLDPQPLLDLRIRIATAMGQLAGARAAESASRREVERLDHLFRKRGNVSEKAAEAGEAVWKADAGHLEAARETFKRLRQTARNEWGAVLGGWATEAGPKSLSGLMGGGEALLLVTFPSGEEPRAPPAQVQVQVDSVGPKTQAQIVSPAPRLNSAVQGATYFYSMPSRNVRIGMRLSVDVPLTGKRFRGVIVPSSAVVWYEGKAWDYVEETSGHFRRTEIPVSTPVPNGWFVTGVVPDSRMVIQGAQLLLSQELQPELNGTARSQATENEADDDDD